MTDSRCVPSIAAIGVLSWDEISVLDRYPTEGGYSMVQRTLAGPGGTTGNIAMTARRLGADVSILAKVGADQHGADIVRSLQTSGIRTDGCLTVDAETDVSTVLVSSQTTERTILWKQGPHIRRGDRIDIDALFGADVTIVDCIDYELRKFLTDLPAHTRPNARLIGPLTYIADVVACDKVEVALRHDVLIGNEREYRALLGLDDGEACLKAIVGLMTGNTARVAVMTQGDRGAQAATREGMVTVTAQAVHAVDSTGAGDAFVGAFAYALAVRWDLKRSLGFANAVASCVVATLGAQSGLPSYDEAMQAAGLSR